MPSYFSVVDGLFFVDLFHFLLPFLLLVTFVNYLLPLKADKVSYLVHFLIVQGEGVRLYLFILISFTIEGEGVEVNVLVSPSFDMWKEEGKP